MASKAVAATKPHQRRIQFSRVLKRRNTPEKKRSPSDEEASLPRELQNKILNGEIIELDTTNYRQVTQDPARDVIVEFYEGNVNPSTPCSNLQNADCRTVDEVCRSIARGYSNNRNQIAFARCDIHSGAKFGKLYCIPAIKLFPAKDKYPPIEYCPNDYSNQDGYKNFIQREGAHQLPWQSPESPVGLSENI